MIAQTDAGIDAAALLAALDEQQLLLHTDWTVRTSNRRRTVGLTVGPGGSIELAAPADASLTDVVNVVRTRSDWLARMVARHAILTPEHPVKRLVTGENYPLLGRNRRLRLVHGDVEAPSVSGAELRLSDQGSAANVENVVETYRQAGRRWLSVHGERWANRFGATAVPMDVRDVGHRWGIRQTDETVVLHWALFQLPARLVELVLAHELAHLTAPHHGSRFDRTVARAMPDYEVRTEDLARAGTNLWIGDVIGAC